MFTPKYITFDCYGTLTRFRISEMTRNFFKDRVPADKMDAFVADYSAFRFDEVLGAWKPYGQVISDSLERTCKLWEVAFRPSEAQAIYEAVPSMGAACRCARGACESGQAHSARHPLQCLERSNP